MPRGKGTYGSKVGRPPKNNKYKGGGIAKALELMGGSVDPFSTLNPEGVPSEKLEEAMEDQNMANEGIPTENAMDRSETYQLGGPVRPPMSPSITPTPQYKKGGKVNGKSKSILHYGKGSTEIQSMKMPTRGGIKVSQDDPKLKKLREKDPRSFLHKIKGIESLKNLERRKGKRNKWL